MLYIIYALKILLLSGIPIALGIYLVRKFELEGRWWWIGVVVFIVSLIILQSLDNYLIVPYLYSLNFSGVLPSVEVLIYGGLLLGLSAGLCEELLLFSTFRWWAKDARSFESGMLLGAGFGGAASIFLGFQVLAYWTELDYYSVPVIICQLLMIVIQIGLVVMVLQAFSRKKFFWVWLAIGFNTLVESARFIIPNLSSDNLTVAVLCIFTIFSVMIIMALRRSNNSNSTGILGQVAPMNQAGK